MTWKNTLILIAAAAAAFIAGLYVEPALPSSWQRVFLRGRKTDWISRRDLPSVLRQASNWSAGASPASSVAHVRAHPSSRPLSSLEASARREMIARLTHQKILELETDYKPFLDKLPPDQAAALRQLLVSAKEALLQGIEDRQASGASAADLAAFDAQSGRDLNDQVHALLGDDEYQAYKDFTTVLPYVKEGEQIGNRLYAENVPATSDQINAVVQAMLAAPKPPSMDRVADGSLSVADYGQALSQASAGFVQSVSSILNPDQVKVLQAYEQETQARYVRAATMLMSQNAGAR